MFLCQSARPLRHNQIGGESDEGGRCHSSAHHLGESARRERESVRSRVCDSAHMFVRVCVCSHIKKKGERWLALAVKGKKKFGFSKEASYCPCLRLLIYELVKEISHLSLFISFLHVILFFSLSFSHTLSQWNSAFPPNLPLLPKNGEEERERIRGGKGRQRGKQPGVSRSLFRIWLKPSLNKRGLSEWICFSKYSWVLTCQRNVFCLW